MTPYASALEHFAWCIRRGMSPADICDSVQCRGSTAEDALNALLLAAEEMRDDQQPDLRLVGGGMR